MLAGISLYAVAPLSLTLLIGNQLFYVGHVKKSA